MAATPIRQLYSRQEWLSDGTDSLWNFSFTGGYIDKTHVKARITNPANGNTELIPINYSADFIGPFQLRVLPNVPAGYILAIYRDTPKDLPIVDFQDGGRISEVSLDTNAKQAVFIASETVDAILGEIFGYTLLDEEFGYKTLRKQPYTGASTVAVLDNGRAHYKTDGTAVAVPSTLKDEFMTSIINDSASNMSLSFPSGGAILQGSVDTTVYTNWIISPRNLVTIAHIRPGVWFLSGKAAPA